MKYLFLGFVLSLMSLACRIQSEHIDQSLPEINHYVQVFLQEGKKRGIDLSNKSDMLQVQLGKLPDTKSGVCQAIKEKRRIILNEKMWSKLDSFQRKALVFHELGHCLLDRDHLNDELPRGECKSIMVETKSDSTCYYNYYSEGWMAYYLDELFGVVNGPPDWYGADSMVGAKKMAKPFWDTLVVSRRFVSSSLNDLKDQDYHMLLDFLDNEQSINSISLYWDGLRILLNLYGKELHIDGHSQIDRLGKMIPRIFFTYQIPDSVKKITLIRTKEYLEVFINESMMYKTQADLPKHLKHNDFYASWVTESEIEVKCSVNVSPRSDSH